MLYPARRQGFGSEIVVERPVREIAGQACGSHGNTEGAADAGRIRDTLQRRAGAEDLLALGIGWIEIVKQLLDALRVV